MGKALAHDMYGEYKQNGSEASCCSGKDCRPVTMCTLPSGQEGFIYIPMEDSGRIMTEVPGRCLPIPWDRVIPQPSHDGQNHICDPTRAPGADLTYIPYTYCFIRGGGF